MNLKKLLLTPEQIQNEQYKWHDRDKEFGMMTWPEWLCRTQLKAVSDYLASQVTKEEAELKSKIISIMNVDCGGCIDFELCDFDCEKEKYCPEENSRADSILSLLAVKRAK
jgi:hypothetical protein